MLVTEGGHDETSGALHTLDASRSSSLASAVKPEVKLKAILEITRKLSSDLKIDTVAPNIIDALMELFPQSERGFLILIDQVSKRLIRKAFKYRPNKQTSLIAPYTDEVPMSISRSIVNHVIGQKKAVLSQDAGADQSTCPPAPRSPTSRFARSCACRLLAFDGEVLGIIQLDTSSRRQFLQEDLDILTTGRRPGGRRGPERLDAREAAPQRLARARPEHRRDGPEAVPAPVGPQDPRLRVFRLSTSPPTRSAATTTTSSTCPRTSWGSRWATWPARGWPRP